MRLRRCEKAITMGYRGESSLGKLMHDFNCTQASDMNFELMADRTRYLKENPKGVSEMCRIR